MGEAGCGGGVAEGDHGGGFGDEFVREECVGWAKRVSDTKAGGTSRRGER